MSNDGKVISRFWLTAAVFGAALGWLLPNNSPPWLSFHQEAWLAFMLLLVSGWILTKQRQTFTVHGFPLLMAVLSVIPLIQFAYGQIPLLGAAWTPALYLLGFALSMLIGAAWENESPNQLADFIFLATGLAGIASTVIQIYQWLGLRSISIWILYNALPNRYYANLAQPNLLASLLLLGVIACAWAYWRKTLPGWAATSLAAFLLFGVALTGSRTGILNIALLVAIASIWRKKLGSKHILGVIFCLAVYCVLCFILMPHINTLLKISEDRIPIEFRGLRDVRLSAWAMLLDAAIRQPWFGYGWGQVARANYFVLPDYPIQYGVFSSAHNLFLDLILWVGFPLGLACSAYIIWWASRVIKGLGHFGQICMFAFVVVLGVHALLELPLHYAYFLLPLGLIIGALNTSLTLSQFFRVHCVAIMVIWSLVAIAYVILVRDYFRVETSFYGLRFEDRGIASPIPKTPPDVIVLTQFREMIAFARNTPRPGLSELELDDMRDLVKTISSPIGIHKLAANLALNGHPEEAQSWMRAHCKTSPPELCLAMELRWRNLSLAYPALSAVPWPSEFTSK